MTNNFFCCICCGSYPFSRKPWGT